jgi:predicted metalloprotease with PDZ domain
MAVRLRLALASLALTTLTPAWATIDYQVDVDPTGKMSVAVTIPVRAEETVVQIPNWAPGSYRLSDNFARMSEVRFVAPDGRILTHGHPDPSTWTAPTKGLSSVKFKYSVPIQVRNGTAHWSGPSTYVYVVGRIGEACRLQLGLPNGWKSACGLDGGSRHRYTAPDYDVLADNPVTVGTFVEDTYVTQGIRHQIVYHTGDASRLDRAAVIANCRFVSESQSAFWGGLPFKKYVWHFNPFEAADGGGGLEHLSSTQITLATGLGSGTVSVISHEYFHAWNVKRIRSSVLGPFDYQQLPQTGALWWLEGVTDYYADLLLFRYGRYDEEYWHRNIVSNVDRTRSVAARMTVSPYDSSFRVREAANGRGNSQGFGVNYYNTGWVVGLCLDIEIRDQTGGKRSLDDVCRILWEQCKDGRDGFPEDGIRRALVQVGGTALGTAYDEWVMKPGELPVEAQLAKIGMAMGQTEVPATDIGVTGRASARAGGVMVGTVRQADSGLKEGDVIVSLDGQAIGGLETRAMSEAWTAAQAKPVGESVTVEAKRGEETVKATLKVMATTRTLRSVSPMADAPAEAVALREGLYVSGVAKIPFGSR